MREYGWQRQLTPRRFHPVLFPTFPESMTKRTRVPIRKTKSRLAALNWNSEQRDSMALLGFDLCEVLVANAGEHGGAGEGALDTLCRIIAERDRAFKILALDRLKRFGEQIFPNI